MCDNCKLLERITKKQRRRGLFDLYEHTCVRCGTKFSTMEKAARYCIACWDKVGEE